MVPAIWVPWPWNLAAAERPGEIAIDQEAAAPTLDHHGVVAHLLIAIGGERQARVDDRDRHAAPAEVAWSDFIEVERLDGPRPCVPDEPWNASTERFPAELRRRFGATCRPYERR